MKIMERNFVLLLRKGVTSKFSLNDIPGSGGRVDIGCRALTQSIWLSHNIRRDTNFYLVCEGPPKPPITILFLGKSIKRVSPDERNIASWINKALEIISSSKNSLKAKENWLKVQEGIRIRKIGLIPLLREMREKKGSEIIVLHEKGEPIDNLEVDEIKPLTFVLGDHKGLPKKEEDYVVNVIKGKKISLGKKSYLASSCIAIVHYILDKKIEKN